MSYPVKLRERALQALLEGYTKAEVNKMLGLGVNTLRDWEKLEAETGLLENRPLNRGAYKIDREKLLEYYRKNPYSTNKEAAIAFNYIRNSKCEESIENHAKKTQFSTQNATNKNAKSLLTK